MNDPTEVKVVSFGCRLNLVESEMMRIQAQRAGLSDAIIVNTCAVTQESVRQARQNIRRLKREHPHSRLIVSGCAAQIFRENFADMTEVDDILDNASKTQPQSWVSLAGGKASLPQDENASKLASSNHTRGFLPIQNGCDHRCTFCIIPFGRGPSRSKPAGAILEEAQNLVAAGHKDIVLTGVDLTSWGEDLPGRPKLSRLLRQILKFTPHLSRLRLSSLDCIETDEEFLRVLAEEPRLMPHLHLSLQAGDNLILKRMKRRHSREHAIAFCQQARRLRPDIVFGADWIAGFPTETEEHFQNTMNLVEECGLTHLHVFPFSPRPGTSAARMPQVDKAIIKERAARLRALGAKRLKQHLDSQIGLEVEILSERGGYGHTRDFSRVATPGVDPGVLFRAKILRHDGTHLVAQQPAHDFA